MSREEIYLAGSFRPEHPHLVLEYNKRMLVKRRNDPANRYYEYTNVSIPLPDDLVIETQLEDGIRYDVSVLIHRFPKMIAPQREYETRKELLKVFSAMAADKLFHTYFTDLPADDESIFVYFLEGHCYLFREKTNQSAYPLEETPLKLVAISILTTTGYLQKAMADVEAVGHEDISEEEPTAEWILEKMEFPVRMVIGIEYLEHKLETELIIQGGIVYFMDDENKMKMIREVLNDADVPGPILIACRKKNVKAWKKFLSSQCSRKVHILTEKQDPVMLPEAHSVYIAEEQRWTDVPLAEGGEDPDAPAPKKTKLTGQPPKTIFFDGADRKGVEYMHKVQGGPNRWLLTTNAYEGVINSYTFAAGLHNDPNAETIDMFRFPIAISFAEKYHRSQRL